MDTCSELQRKIDNMKWFTKKEKALLQQNDSGVQKGRFI